MELIGVTINHKTAPLEVRERFRLHGERRSEVERSLAQSAQESMVLSTCERLELYAVGESRRGPEALAAAVASLARTGPTDAHRLPDVGQSATEDLPSAHAVRLEGITVSRHLLRVAAGLESRIIGEPHILGQVRQAYLHALERRTIGPILSALGRAAIHAGKRVRHETMLNPSARSIVTLTVEALQRSLGRLSNARVLIVGSGRLAGDLAATLAYRGARLRFMSRSLERAQALAVRYQVPAAALDELSIWLAEADAAVTCSSSPDYVLSASHVNLLCDRTMPVIDLSVPRNVDPRLATCRGVTLRHLDDLLAQQVGHRDGVEAAERIVTEENERFAAWRRERDVAPLISGLSEGAATFGVATREHSRRLHARIMALKAEVAA